ncbi:TasA family protein [Bacillus suaedaesalsae]|uniref:LPXTG cell wall anchor domain-containing protein n=1 Tax=Bacillus suaedaesalsae TaxID=2810349 RepID=A0ABS2DKM4_9BACI|nr:TasA family protein [Bacillus suaedaesalsae]MBM6619057.1 LPXTG cell wall anchor domain-containing protein [Bacillus suaedaesalsae]
MRIMTLLLILLFLVKPLSVLGETNTNIPQVDLATEPHKVLFDLTNMKPGDSVTRNLTISNNGKNSFNYLTTSKYLSGSEIFYKQLDLTVKDSKGIIYEGKLYNFSKLAPRLLESKQKETLTFHVTIPMELGNEYQGLTCDFQIYLYVEGDVPVGVMLPDTATNTFNWLLIGACLLATGTILGLSYKRVRQKD